MAADRINYPLDHDGVLKRIETEWVQGKGRTPNQLHAKLGLHVSWIGKARTGGKRANRTDTRRVWFQIIDELDYGE
jgi:hypothetical protein